MRDFKFGTNYLILSYKPSGSIEIYTFDASNSRNSGFCYVPLDDVPAVIGRLQELYDEGKAAGF